MTVITKIKKRGILNFSKREKSALRFLKEFFQLPDNYKLNRKTELSNLSEGLHAVINFTYEIEKRFQVELTDEESDALCLGTIETYLRILRKLKLLTAEINEVSKCK